MQRCYHYERAFEHYLRVRRIPYVGVNEARKTLAAGAGSLKSFDFVIYGSVTNLLVDVKGRKLAGKPTSSRHLESWVAREDVEALRSWQRLFGAGFEAAFVFVYWCEAMPAGPLFEETFAWRDRIYALRAVRVADYAQKMKPRSTRWRTVDLPAATFHQVAMPLVAAS